MFAALVIQHRVHGRPAFVLHAASREGMRLAAEPLRIQAPSEQSALERLQGSAHFMLLWHVCF